MQLQTFYKHFNAVLIQADGSYGPCAVIIRSTAGVQSGYSRGTLRVQLGYSEGYSQGTVRGTVGYSQGTVGGAVRVQQGYSGV